MKQLWGAFLEDYGIYHALPERRALAVFFACMTFSLLAAAMSAALVDLQFTGDADLGLIVSFGCALVALPFAFALDRFRTKPFSSSRSHNVWFAVLVAAIISVYLFGLPVISIALLIVVHSLLSGTAVVVGLLNTTKEPPAPPIES